MTASDGMQPVAVNVGECRCIGAPHTSGDEVYLMPEVSLSLGLLCNGAMAVAGDDNAMMETLLGRAFIDGGIVSWTFLESDEPVPVTPANVARMLPWGKGGALVSERANDLYSEDVLAPLRRRSTQRPQPGPIGDSTSPIQPSRAQRRHSSKSSSRAPSEMPR